MARSGCGPRSLFFFALAGVSLIASIAGAGSPVDVSFVGGILRFEGAANAVGVQDAVSASFPVTATGVSGSASTGTGIVEWSRSVTATASVDVGIPDGGPASVLNLVLSTGGASTCGDYDLGGACCSGQVSAQVTGLIRVNRDAIVWGVSGSGAILLQDIGPLTPGVLLSEECVYPFSASAPANLQVIFLENERSDSKDEVVVFTGALQIQGSAVTGGTEDSFLELVSFTFHESKSVSATATATGTADAEATASADIRIDGEGAQTAVHIDISGSSSAYADCGEASAEMNVVSGKTDPIIIELGEPANVVMCSEAFTLVPITGGIDEQAGWHQPGTYALNFSVSASAGERSCTLRFESVGLNPDFNNDGVVDGADLGILLSAWGGCDALECSQDLNFDGVVDGADLGILLAYWD